MKQKILLFLILLLGAVLIPIGFFAFSIICEIAFNDMMPTVTQSLYVFFVTMLFVTQICLGIKYRKSVKSRDGMLYFERENVPAGIIISVSFILLFFLIIIMLFVLAGFIGGSLEMVPTAEDVAESRIASSLIFYPCLVGMYILASVIVRASKARRV